VLVRIDIVPVSDYTPHSEFGGQPSFCNTVHKSLGLQSIRDELSYGDKSEIVLRGELLELLTASCGPVLVENLTDNASGIESRQAREIDRRFRVTHTLQNSAITGTKRRNVSRASQISGHGHGIDCNANCLRAILRADARSHSEPRGGIDRDCERGPLLFTVLFALLRKLKLICALAG
jgi:hypothetical protein